MRCGTFSGVHMFVSNSFGICHPQASNDDLLEGEEDSTYFANPSVPSLRRPPHTRRGHRG